MPVYTIHYFLDRQSMWTLLHKSFVGSRNGLFFKFFRPDSVQNESNLWFPSLSYHQNIFENAYEFFLKQYSFFRSFLGVV